MKTIQFYLLAIQSSAANAQAGDRIWCKPLLSFTNNPVNLRFSRGHCARLRSKPPRRHHLADV
jgi:hypothetical protein